MRIRGSAAASSVFPTPASLSPSSPSSCSSSSSCFSSSSSSTHSTISDHHSLSSSSNSTSPSFSLLPLPRRCQGLDLLVKAVYHVAGSVVGVPYIQKRVIRRRKPALRFNNLVISSDKEERELEKENDQVGEVLDGNSEDKKKKQRRRSKALPLKPVIRRRRRSKV